MHDTACFVTRFLEAGMFSNKETISQLCPYQDAQGQGDRQQHCNQSILFRVLDIQAHHEHGRHTKQSA